MSGAARSTPVAGRPAGRRARPPSGRLLAERLGVAFRDTDADVEAAAGKPVADIFIDDGEDALPRAGARRGRRARWPSTTACWRSAAARSDAGTQALLRGAGVPVVLPATSIWTPRPGGSACRTGRCWPATRAAAADHA